MNGPQHAININSNQIDSKTNNPVQINTYQHYKRGNLYQVLGFALNSETYEEMVIYQALYNCDKFGNNQIWVRPKKMFFENVEHDGKIVPRFKLAEE